MIYTTDWEYNRAARKKQAMAEGKATAARVAVYEARIAELEEALRQGQLLVDQAERRVRGVIARVRVS
jgi:anti-sigma28 factor (negative regulator of flagellin synthesis)